VIGLLFAAAVVLMAPTVPTAPPDVPPLRPRPTPPPAVAPATMLARYAEALAANPTPSVLSFEYSIDQTGARDIQQTHRVFRSGNSERDELLSIDGKKLVPPSIHIFLGHRNRYALEALAPRPEAYAFRYIGTVRDGRHVDEVFATTPRSPSDVTISRVTIDGVSALPVTIRFVTRSHGGSGSVTFGRVQKHWMATAASATATYAKSLAIEHIVFSRYRFPTTLAASTFSTPRPLPSFRPTPY
jgi:hypothetical protein